MASIGIHPIDADLLRVAGVAFRLFRIDDFASNQLVLELCSAQTVLNLSQLEGKEDGPSLAALSLGLLFMRINLYGVNSHSFDPSHRVTFLWLSMIFVTSMKGVSNITKRNYLSATVSLVFLVLRKDVDHPRRLTTESAEHQFGCLCTMKR